MIEEHVGGFMNLCNIEAHLFCVSISAGHSSLLLIVVTEKHVRGLKQVPIQVYRSLAYSDCIKSVEPAKFVATAGLSDGLLFTELDMYLFYGPMVLWSECMNQIVK